MKEGSESFSMKARVLSIRHALDGLWEMLVGHHNARIHLMAALCVVISAAFFNVSAIEWSLLVFAIFFVWVTEALNTALELLCDLVSPEFHPLVKKSKDVAAGAVLLSAIAALIIGFIIFIPYLTELST